MPTYKFKCEGECEEFTVTCLPSKIPDKCPECNSDIKQIYSTPNIVLKQGAFYHKGSV